MIRKDYLLKLFQQLDEAMKKVNGLKDEGNTESALALVRESYNKILHIKIPEQYDDQILHDIFQEKALEFDELSVLAELLKEEGDLYFERGDDEQALIKYKIALAVFDYLNQEQKVFSFEREAKINLMLARSKEIEGSM